LRSIYRRLPLSKLVHTSAVKSVPWVINICSIVLMFVFLSSER
jgi:hypothetical protein